jgi:hypothetical protein
MEVFVLIIADYEDGWYVAGVYMSEELAIEAATDVGLLSAGWLIDTFLLDAPAE